MSPLPLLLLALLPLALGCAASVATPGSLAEGSNRAFAHTVRVEAAPGTVWTLWTDVEAWPAWDVELKEASLDGPFEAGTRGTLRPQSGPSSSFRITDVDPGWSYTFETKLPLASLRIRRSWAPAGDGALDITHEVSFHGLSGGLFAGRFGPRFRAALPVAMERIRTLAEAAP